MGPGSSCPPQTFLVSAAPEGAQLRSKLLKAQRSLRILAQGTEMDPENARATSGPWEPLSWATWALDIVKGSVSNSQFEPCPAAPSERGIMIWWFPLNAHPPPPGAQMSLLREELQFDGCPWILLPRSRSCSPSFWGCCLPRSCYHVPQLLLCTWRSLGSPEMPPRSLSKPGATLTAPRS